MFFYTITDVIASLILAAIIFWWAYINIKGKGKPNKDDRNE